MALTDAAKAFQRLPTFEEGEDLRDGRGSRGGVLGSTGLRAWQHAASGVRVVRFADPGPLVSVSIIVGTVPWSDAGHPHTLEHIVFLGSARYPQRGYLDTLACRSLGNGTNAFTANEYTCFTACTAGFEGFSSVLPCLLDHVLRPRIDDAAFASEVYHIRSDGREAGVVFSEMQAREHTEADIADRELRRVLLPGTPLAYEAGGLCDGIRGLSNADIQRYHAEMYCGANVSVVIGGSSTIPDVAILNALAPALEMCVEDPRFRVGERPWSNCQFTLPPLPPVDRRTVHFPCADEEIGSVALAWRGPAGTDYLAIQALNALLRYLSAETSSPLIQTFVDTEDPLASDIYYEFEAYPHTSTLVLMCHGVAHISDSDGSADDPPANSIRPCECAAAGTAGESASHATLEHGTDDAGPNGLSHASVGSHDDDDDMSHGGSDDAGTDDGEHSFLASGKLAHMIMDYLSSICASRKLPGGLAGMHAALHRCKEEFLAELEGNSHDYLPTSLVQELIFDGRPGLKLGESVRGELDRLRFLENQDEAFWLDQIEKYLLHAPRVELTMVPDQAMAERQAHNDDAALKRRVDTIGEDELRAIGDRSNELIARVKPAKMHSLEFPDCPGTENVPRISYKAALSGPGLYHLQSVAVESCHVHATLLVSTDGLTLEQKSCLPLLSELILSMDVEADDGTIIGHSEMSRMIDEATISTEDTGTLLHGPSAMQTECLGIRFAATEQKFATACDLILRAFIGGKVTAERVSSIAHNAESDTTESLRDGHSVLHAASLTVPASRDTSGVDSLSNEEIVCLFGRRKFLSFVADEFARDKPRYRVRRRLLQLLSSTLDALRTQPSDGVFVQIASSEPVRACEIFDSSWSHCVWRPAESTFDSARRAPPGAHLSTGSSAAASSPSHSRAALPITRRPSRRISSWSSGRETAVALGIPGMDGCSFDVYVDSDLVPGHKDWASVCVLAELLSRAEGPLYSAVRGVGFAYHVALEQDVWRGKLNISVGEASSPVQAWIAVCETLRSVRESLGDADRNADTAAELSTAKSAVLFSLLSDRGTPGKIVSSALKLCAQGLPIGALSDRTMEESIEAVDHCAIRSAYDLYVARLLERTARFACLVSNDAILEKTVAEFRACDEPISFELTSLRALDLPHTARVVSALSK